LSSIFLNAVIIENNVFLEVGAYRIAKDKKESHGEEGNVEEIQTGREEEFTVRTVLLTHQVVCAPSWT
jgi:hypothetical protein